MKKMVILVCILVITTSFAANLNKNIGQLMMVGMKGMEVNQNSDIVRQIRDYNVG